MGSHELLLGQMPGELFDGTFVVFLHIVHALVLIGTEHDTLQNLVGPCELTDFLLHVCANVEHELVVAVLLQLRTNLVGDAAAELLLALHRALAIDLVEQLLVDGVLLVAADLGNLIAEVALVLGNLLFLYLEQRADLGIVLRIGLAGVERDNVAQLGTVEVSLFLIHLNILWHEHHVGERDAALERVALGIELTQVALQHVALLGVILLGLLVAAGTRGIHVGLLVNQLVIDLDGVIVNLVLAVQLNLELGSHGNVEDERVGSLLREVHLHLLLRGQGLAEHLDVVVLYVFIKLFAHHAVHGIHLGRQAILPFHQRQGHHARAEAGEVGTLAIVLQHFVHIVLEVCFFYRDGHQAIHLVRVLKRNIHLNTNF